MSTGQQFSLGLALWLVEFVPLVARGVGLGGGGASPVDVAESVVAWLVSCILPVMFALARQRFAACGGGGLYMYFTGRALFALCLVHACMSLNLVCL